MEKDNLPSIVRDCIYDEFLSTRQPACVWVDEEDRIVSCLGAFETYGISIDDVGRKASDVFPVLFGLDYRHDDRLTLPSVGLQHGVTADVQVIRDGADLFVVLTHPLRTQESVEHLQQLAYDALLEEEELRKGYSALEQLASTREDLTQMAVHDIRSPLTAVECYSEMLSINLHSKGMYDEQRMIEQLRATSRQILLLVNDMLDMHKLESAELPLSFENMPIQVIFELAQAQVEAIALAREMTLSFSGIDVEVRCDRKLIGRVLANLLSNAIKHSPDRGKIIIDCQKRGDQALIMVADRGAGIAGDSLEKIFEKFHSSNGERMGETKGLGLAFCKLAIEAHQQEIGVESVLGTGSMFWFSVDASCA